jgi:hypothetical protein
MPTIYTPEQAEEMIGSTTCDHCGAISTIRKRSLNSTMSRQLLALYRFFMYPNIFLNLEMHMRDANSYWIHASHYLTHLRLERECMKLRFWDFIEEHPSPRDDGNPHCGFVRMTIEGVRFCQRRVKAYRYILTKNQGEGFVGFIDGDMIDIIDSLGNNFDYNREIKGVTQPFGNFTGD